MNLYLDEKMAKEKGIDNTELYLKLSNLYKKTFEDYMKSLIDLKKYDDMIKNSDLNFSIPELQNPTLNALNEYLNLDFIYNLNNYFVEKLSVEDIELLKNNTNLTLLVKRTYKTVLVYGNEKCNVCYGPSSDINFARNDAVVFKLYYKIIDDNNDLDIFLAKDKKIKELINFVVNSIKNEVESKLDINCDFLIEMCM